jgi:hypothetical protein
MVAFRLFEAAVRRRVAAQEVSIMIPERGAACVLSAVGEQKARVCRHSR